MSKSTFYHAGCSVCVSAEQEIIRLIDPSLLEIVNFNESKTRYEEAVKAGVKSVPAVVTPSGNVLHINFGAAMEDL
jgi:predicted thioredoxin/glutaredoxin